MAYVPTAIRTRADAPAHEFIKAAEDSDTARTSAERQRLDQMAAALEREKGAQARERAALRRGQRALAAASGLFACVILGAIGWYNQEFLKEQYQWCLVMRPSVPTTEQEKSKPGSDFKKFVMSSSEIVRDRPDDERPQHEVTITKPFAVGKFDVTYAEWDTCVAAGACPKAIGSGWGRDDRPVINVSWHEAKIYVNWLAKQTGKRYRLLTEAEWEYAARVDKQGRYSFGDDRTQLREYAWYILNKAGKTQPVGKKKPNAFGLYDMHGNVWQWIEDCYYGTYAGAPADGKAASEEPGCSRVARGGSWIDVPEILQSAFRAWLDADRRKSNYGFRVGRTLAP